MQIFKNNSNRATDCVVFTGCLKIKVFIVTRKNSRNYQLYSENQKTMNM